MKCDHVIFSQTEDTCSTFESGHIDQHQYCELLKFGCLGMNNITRGPDCKVMVVIGPVIHVLHVVMILA